MVHVRHRLGPVKALFYEFFFLLRDIASAHVSLVSEGHLDCSGRAYESGVSQQSVRPNRQHVVDKS